MKVCLYSLFIFAVLCLVISDGRGRRRRRCLRRLARLVERKRALQNELNECQRESTTLSVTTDASSSGTTEPPPVCTGCSNIETVPAGFTSVSYTKSEEYLENPGRGFFRMLETKASSFSPLTVASLDTLRANNGINNGLRVFILDSFVTSSISNDFLEKIRADMRVVGEAGWTMALRFHYTNIARSSAPYGDATKAIMLQHIGQISPILYEFEGLISVIQAGFIGIWGEWYYTTDFGDPTQGPLTDQNWQDRREIVMALINSSPQSIPIQLRTPEAKMKICNTTTPATLSDVHQNTCVGRAGQHNDCFLGDDTDVGTYTDVTTEKAYLAQDTLHLPMSGETCQRSVDANGQETSRSGCETALRELFGFHWTLLHDNYNLDVLNDWKSERCFYIIHQNLGYRLYLKNVILPTSVEAGGEVCYHIVLSNIVSAPYKPWKVALVFKSQTGSQYYAVDLDNVDVRSWLPGPDIVLSGTTKLPSDATSGTYDMFLAIYDEKTKQLSNYYILLANTGVPQYTAGLNSLQTTIQVSGVNSETSSCTSATTWTPPTPGTYSRIFIPPT